MIQILIGLMLIFIPIPIPRFVGALVLLIDYMPHFLGYVLIFWGLSRSVDTPSRGSAMAVAVASAVASGALWVAGLLGYGMTFPLPALLQLFVTYQLLVWCEELKEMEQSYLIRRFRLSWYALLGAQIAAIVLGAFLPPLGWVWSAVAFVAALYFTYTYYRLQSMVER